MIKKANKSHTYIFIILVLTMLLSGCFPNTSFKPEPTATPADTTVDTVILGYSEHFTTLNPFFADTTTNVDMDIVNLTQLFLLDVEDIIIGNAVAAQIVIYTRNSAINIYRKNKRRFEVEISSANGGADDNRETDFADESADIDSIVLNRETAEIIRKYILLLPQEYQDVISLVYGMGYSNVEAARILNITSNAVGLRIYKAKKKLLQMAGGELRERLE